MSRSYRGNKGFGYDYWSRRPYSTSWGYGPWVKKMTHKAERRIASNEVRKAQSDMQKKDYES